MNIRIRSCAGVLMLCILASVFCFSAAADEPIVIAMYPEIPELDRFTGAVTAEWERRGHTEKLMFVPWDCYSGFPAEDSDIYCYDSGLFYTLEEAGLLRRRETAELPACSFPWTERLGAEDVSGTAYPFILCADFVITRAENAAVLSAPSLDRLDCTPTAPVKSMAFSWYGREYSTRNGDIPPMAGPGFEWDENSLNAVLIIAGITEEAWYASSSFSNYTGTERFADGEADALYGFSESIYGLGIPTEELCLRCIPSEEGMPNGFFVDYLSVSAAADDTKAEKCLEVIGIMTDAEIQYNWAANDGSPLYSIPASREALTRLAAEDRLYAVILEDTEKESNIVAYYNGAYYADKPALKPILLSFIEEMFEEQAVPAA